MLKATPKKSASGYCRLPHGRVIFLLLSLSGCLSLVTGCVMHSFSPGLTANLPETKIIDLRSSLVSKALVQVLNERKFVVNPGKSTQQSVETEWLQDGLFRSMVSAKVKPVDKFHSELTVHLRLERKSFWSKSWQPFDKIERTAYADFMNAVLIESYRILYDSR